MMPMASWDHAQPLVQGDAAFAATMREALALLQDHWGWLSDHVHVIRPAESGELPAGALAGLLVRDGGYIMVASTSFPWGEYTAAYVASVLAHEAVHAQQHSSGQRYYGRDAEQLAWAAQAWILSDLAPGHATVPWMLSSIAGLPDGGPLPGNPS